MKNNTRGITLIALIITVIILLILAGTAVAISINSGDIFTKTDTSVKETNYKALKESVSVALITCNAYGTGDTFKEKLESQMVGTTITEVEGRTDVLNVQKDGAIVTVYEDGDIVEGNIEIWDGRTVECPELKNENNVWNWYIYTPEQLKFLAEFVNNGNSLTAEAEEGETVEGTDLTNYVTNAGYNAEDVVMSPEATIYLMNNLDLGARWSQDGTLTAGSSWTPIGIKYANVLNKLGTFNGNNYCIKGVYVNIEQNNVGLFGVSNAVQNLTIRNSYIKGMQIVGGIAGRSLKSIENCHNESIVISESSYCGGVAGAVAGNTSNCSNSGEIISKGSSVGGIIGYAHKSCTVSNCTNEGNINSEGGLTGGIIGSLVQNSKVINCNNKGRISGGIGGSSCVGGIVGSAGYTIISYCTNNGDVKSERTRTAGIVGHMAPSSIVEGCVNYGYISGKETYTGGIVGLASTDGKDPSESEGSIVRKCINFGKIDGVQETGGIIGLEAQYHSLVEKCCNFGDVTGTGSSIGGISGNFGRSSRIYNCFNMGKVVGLQYVGGIDGHSYASSGHIKNCYNTGEVSGTTKVGGVLGNNGNSSVIENCYYLEGAANLDVGSGTQSDLSKDKAFITTTFVTAANEEETIWKVDAEENQGWPTLVE